METELKRKNRAYKTLQDMSKHDPKPSCEATTKFNPNLQVTETYKVWPLLYNIEHSMSNLADCY